MTLSLRSSVSLSVSHEGVFFSLRSYNGVSRKSNGCFNEVSRMFDASFMDRKFQESFTGVLRDFEGFFKEVLRMIQGRFRAVQMKFPWCCKKVSRALQKVFGMEVSGVY